MPNSQLPSVPLVEGTSPAARGSIAKAALTGGAPTTIATSDWPLGIGVDGTGIYWVAGQTIGGVYHCPIAGCGPGGPELLVDNQGAPFSLVIDERFIYWTNSSDGRVMAIAKP